MSDTPQVLLAHHLKALKLPTFLREYDKVARQCAAEGVDHVALPAALWPNWSSSTASGAWSSAGSGRPGSRPSRASTASTSPPFPRSTRRWCWNWPAREYVSPPRERHRGRQQRHGQDPRRAGPRPGRLPEGPLGRLHHRRGAGPRTIEARDEKRLLRLQRQLAGYKLLIIDELGYVPLSQTGAELLFEVFSQRYERGSTIVTSNLPFDEWTGVFGSERLTGALLDRLTHHVHILEMNGDSFGSSTAGA